jgi:hypothetical protein
MMLSLDTAYRSFGGEVEASSTPTICRLSDSRRHQLLAIARPDVGEIGYSGRSVMDACTDLLSRASLRRYPFRSEERASYFTPELQQEFQSATDVVLTVDSLLRELEAKLTASEAKRR